ncbi:hypothetical protein [Halobacteriovorax sp. HLS]|uniref:hypothetical protein n=1 Tax=Halobacteriovorax sp. HLS TaxID=2234000 RepID=UPI000FDB0FC7|nr:hypothetical protein [Halobacteriovorax sp. HLS]
MKNELIISTLLLTSPIAKTFAQNASSIIHEANLSTDHLIDIQFISKATSLNIYDRKTEVTVKVSFHEDEDFYWNSQEELPPTIGMNIEVIDNETGRNIYYYGDSFFFAKRIGQNLYRVYDCDSTSSCYADYGYTDFYIFNTPQGKLIKVKNSTSKTNNFLVESLLEIKVD